MIRKIIVGWVVLLAMHATAAMPQQPTQNGPASGQLNDPAAQSSGLLPDEGFPMESAARLGERSSKGPPPPRLPRNFSGHGRYIVPDLRVDVPFTWQGRNGNSQMIAGGWGSPIYFTNLIYGGNLYTLTYKWPVKEPEGQFDDQCIQFEGVSLELLNSLLRDPSVTSYAGAEILIGEKPQYVEHFRFHLVAPEKPPGKYARVPIAMADFYVDEKDSSKIWKVLHFGLQNLLDPNLDEWISMDTFKPDAGQVSLPEECLPPTISGYSWDTVPTSLRFFDGTINGSRFVADHTQVFFCVDGTTTCYEHPATGVRVTSATSLRVTNVLLTAGTYQIYVQRSAGKSARSAAFTVARGTP